MSELIDRQAFRAAHGLGSDCHDCKRDMKSCQYDRDYSLMDFCEWLDDAPTASPWHRVEEELPNEFDTVIVYGRMKYDHEKDYEFFMDAAEYAPFDYARGGWGTFNDWYEGQEEFKITHWMPLPEPPKEDA